MVDVFTVGLFPGRLGSWKLGWFIELPIFCGGTCLLASEHSASGHYSINSLVPIELQEWMGVRARLVERHPGSAHLFDILIDTIQIHFDLPSLYTTWSIPEVCSVPPLS